MRRTPRIFFNNIFPIFIVICLTTPLSQSALEQESILTAPSLPTEIIEYTFAFQNPTASTLTANNQTYTKVEIKGCQDIAQTSGEPMLPVKFIQLALPPFTQIQQIMVTGTPQEISFPQIDLSHQPICPYQPAQPIGIAKPTNFYKDHSIYHSSKLYPGTTYSDHTVGYARGYPIISLSLRPVQYNPKSGKLYHYQELTVTLHLNKTTTLNEFFRGSIDDKTWVQSLVWNKAVVEEYESPNTHIISYPGGLCDPSDTYDYVIITTNHNGLDYWTTSSTIPYNWESLMDKHYIDDNLRCNIVTIQDITACVDYHNTTPLFNDIEAHIREFCKDAYQDWNTDYILIGGDDEWIPAREFDNLFEKDVDSDLYWSNLDNTFNADQDYEWGEPGDGGFDLYSEIFIGRLTCDTPQDVSNWMKKSFFYSDSYDIAYLDNGAFYGGITGWNCEGDEFIDFSAIKGLQDWLGPNPYEEGPWPTWLGFLYGFETYNYKNPNISYNLSVKWTAETPNPGWQGGSESQAVTGLRNAINANQVTLISGIAHSNSNMSLDVHDSEWEAYYHNTKPFFIHDYGCHCGDMDASDDGILHSMLFHSDTELAFGCVYNTGFGWGNLNTTNASSALQQKLFWHYFFDTGNNSKQYGNWQLGKGHAWSKDIMAPTINWGQSYEDGDPWRSVIQGCLLFADPAQKLKPPRNNSPPDTPTRPSGPLEGAVGTDHTFSTMGTDPESDPLLYMFDWGDGTYSTWLGPFDSGRVISDSHSWLETGSYSIRVKSQDNYGRYSQWSEPTSISIGLTEIIIDQARGGLRKISVNVKNSGTLDAINTQWNATVTGGILSLINIPSSGIIDTLSKGSTITINPGSPRFGLGKLSMMIKVSTNYTMPVTKIFNGLIFGPFIII